MSFIRCLSNPEGLYVFHSADFISILWGYDYRWPWAYNKSCDPPNDNQMRIPPSVFYRGIRKWWIGNPDDGVRVGKFYIKEVKVFADTGKEVSENYVFKGAVQRKINWMIKIGYGKKYVIVHQVTMHYMAFHVMRQQVRSSIAKVKNKQLRSFLYRM